MDVLFCAIMSSTCHCTLPGTRPQTLTTRRPSLLQAVSMMATDVTLCQPSEVSPLFYLSPWKQESPVSSLKVSPDINAQSPKQHSCLVLTRLAKACRARGVTSLLRNHGQVLRLARPPVMKMRQRHLHHK